MGSISVNKSIEETPKWGPIVLQVGSIPATHGSTESFLLHFMYLTLLPPFSRSLVALGNRAILFPSLHASDFPSGGASHKDSKQRAAARLLTCKVFIQNLPAGLLAHSLAWQDCGLMRTRAHVTASCACSSRCRWSLRCSPSSCTFPPRYRPTDAGPRAENLGALLLAPSFL